MKHVEMVEDKNNPGDWRVEAIMNDGEVQVAIFSGPNAYYEADSYLSWRWLD